MNEITESGGIFNTTPPTLTDGTRTEIQVGSRGSQFVTLRADGSTVSVGTSGGADAISVSTTALLVRALTGLYNGATYDSQRTPNVFKVISGVALLAATDTTIWTPAASKKFRLMGFLLAYSVASRIVLKDNTAGTVIRVIPAGVGVWIASAPSEGNGTLSAAANNVLSVNAVNAGTLDGYVFGTEE